MSASKSPVQSSIAKVNARCDFGRLYVWRSGWVGTVDHDDDKDEDEKGQRNRSIASLHSEIL